MRTTAALALCWTLAAPTAFAQQVPAPGQPQNLPIGARVKLAGRTFELEVARTNQQRSIGLMFRTNLPADRGMVFLFEPPQPTAFWMRNTLIPLDMVFAHQGRIVDIQQDVPPCKTPQCPVYGPNYSTLVDTVVEFNAGTARKLGLKVGDRLLVEFLSAPASQPGR